MLIWRIYRAVLFYIFANLCKSSLMEDSWILLFASVFNLLCYHTSRRLWKILPYSHENESEEGKKHLSYFETSFDSEVKKYNVDFNGPLKKVLKCVYIHILIYILNKWIILYIEYDYTCFFHWPWIVDIYFKICVCVCVCIYMYAAAAKSLQLCPTLCDPVDGSPPGSPVPGILQARTLEWVAIIHIYI